jgi:hypothetical protein
MVRSTTRHELHNRAESCRGIRVRVGQVKFINAHWFAGPRLVLDPASQLETIRLRVDVVSLHKELGLAPPLLGVEGGGIWAIEPAPLALNAKWVCCAQTPALRGEFIHVLSPLQRTLTRHAGVFVWNADH